MFLLILRFMSMIENAIVTFVHVSVTVPVDAVILVFDNLSHTISPTGSHPLNTIVFSDIVFGH